MDSCYSVRSPTESPQTDLLTELVYLVDGPAEVMRFIPHRPPFVLVDALLACTDSTAVGQFTAPPTGHVMVCNGFFEEPGLLEHQAQVAALQAGYQAHKNQDPPKMGYVAGFRTIVIDALPRPGDVLTTTLQTLNQLGNLTLLRAETHVNGVRIATSDFTVVLEPA